MLLTHTYYLVWQLVILCTFAPCSGANVKIGVPENYDGIFPWYLAKVRYNLPEFIKQMFVLHSKAFC